MRDEFGAWARGTTFLSPNSKLYKMPQVIAAGLQAAGMTGTFTAFGATISYATVAAYAIYTVGTAWALRQLQQKALAGMGGTLANIREVDAAKQIIYGQTRVGGVVTYLESSDNQSNLLQVICLAGHPVEEIGDIYIDDKRIAAANVGSGSSLGGSVDDPDWKKGSNKYVTVRKGNGSNNSSALSSLINVRTENSDIDANFTGNNVSFLYTDLEYNKDVFSNGVPTFGAVVKGRKVYDPRKDSTSDAYDSGLGVSTHRKTNSSTWEYSNNPALCILDYLIQDHGLNADFDEISDTDWANEADICDETVTLADTTTQNRYELNGVFTRDRSPSDIIPAMLSSCGGTLFYAQGKWVLRVGKYRTPLSTGFDEDDLRGSLSIDTKASRRDIFNAVTGQFQAPSEDWVPSDYPMITSTTFETEDGGDRNTLDLPLPFTTDSAMAQRLAKQTLYKAREQIVVSGRFGLKAFQVQVGDTIKLTNSRLGWTNKTFEVIGWKFAYGDAADLQVDLTLKETSAAVYDWNAEEEGFSLNNTNLPKFTFSPQPTFDGSPTTEVIIQSDGTTVVNAEVAWTVTDDSLVNDYVLEWKRTGETNYQSVVTTNQFYRISGVEVGDTYDLRVSSRNRLGISSDTSSTTVTITADTTAPSAPTSTSVESAFRSNIVSWTNPTDNDFKDVEVYVNTVNNSGTATLLGTASGSSFVHGGLPEEATRYYWVKARDFTGNTSGFSSGANGTTLTDPSGQAGADGADGDDGATGDTVVTGKVFYQTLQSGAPSTPSATSYNVSTASFTGLTSGWSLTQPSVEITDTSVKEWSSNFTVTIDGVTSAQTIVFTTPSGAIQVTADLESDNYVAGTSGWKIERATGNAEFQDATIRGTLVADDITTGTLNGNNVSITNLNATNITAGTLEADHIKLTGSQLQNSSGSLIISSGGVDTAEIAANAVSGQNRFQTSSGYGSNASPFGAQIASHTVSATIGDKFYISTEVAYFNLANWTTGSDFFSMYTFLNGASFSLTALNYPSTSTYHGGLHYGGVFTATATGNLALTVNLYTNESTANSIQAVNFKVNVLKLER